MAFTILKAPVSAPALHSPWLAGWMGAPEHPGAAARQRVQHRCSSRWGDAHQFMKSEREVAEF